MLQCSMLISSTDKQQGSIISLQVMIFLVTCIYNSAALGSLMTPQQVIHKCSNDFDLEMFMLLILSVLWFSATLTISVALRCLLTGIILNITILKRLYLLRTLKIGHYPFHLNLALFSPLHYACWWNLSKSIKPLETRMSCVRLGCIECLSFQIPLNWH